MILIDFAPGLHGHFLEFIVNRYIFDVEYCIDSIFQSTGAAHVINVDPVYQQNKIVESRHYSSLMNNRYYSENINQIIFIKHNPNFDFVLLTNIFYRCHSKAIHSKDIDVDLIIEFHKQLMAADSVTDQDLKNNWFAKLQGRHFVECEKKAKSNILVFDFDFGSFFTLTTFLKELQRTADYLGMTFKFDQSLVNIWNEFIEKNQGYKLYNLGNHLLTQIYNNHTVEIPNDWKLHAYINHNIAETFRLYDGELFESEAYPTNTQHIHKIILNHIASFDTRFS